MVSKTELSTSYRHVSAKILDEFPQVLEYVSKELVIKPRQISISMESPVENPSATLDSFNRQFQLNEQERSAVEWAWPQEAGDTMFAVFNTYTRATPVRGIACGTQLSGCSELAGMCWDVELKDGMGDCPARGGWGNFLIAIGGISTD
jgi:hypothetical protein